MQTKKLSSTIIFIVFLVVHVNALEYHVSKTGKDSNTGSIKEPFKTISKAAQIALPGDTITVHKGVYREWVSPEHGGRSNTQRIIYQAAEGEEVWIKGSEVIHNWKKHKGKVWVATIDNSLFGDFNPYQEVLAGDWLITKYGREHHLGEVYVNGKALYEIDFLQKVFEETPLPRAKDEEASKYKWCCISDETTTTIYANFNGRNPNKELVEINVRPTIFFPKKTGVNYITVKGFNMCHAATQWAPPTAEQMGLIGPYWSKGWIIEDNLISDSKCTGISLGKEKSTGHNEWTNLKVKQGAQREREVICRALQKGWSKESIGSHIIRNNTIKDCEQTGICGHLGCIFSQIYNNHIYNIHVKNQFFGHEIGGIKLHAPIDVLIKGNCIHDNFRGLWLDWQSQGARVSSNIFFNNDINDLYIEVNHGPLLIDNNILLSKTSIANVSQGTAFVHNFIGGNITLGSVKNRFTPYHFPHSTKILGFMTILSGDDRYYNNIFAGNNKPTKHQFMGLNIYNSHPLITDDWCTGRTVNDYANHKLPVFINSNLYYNYAEPFNREVNKLVNRDYKVMASIEQEGNAFYLNLIIDESYKNVEAEIITTEILGSAFQPEASFEQTDGSSISIDKDYFGQNRNIEKPTVGPFKSLNEGENKIRVFDAE